jgi:hypothetical protein
LQRNGFILVFKPTIPYVDRDGHKTMKGNVDHTSSLKDRSQPLPIANA